MPRSMTPRTAVMNTEAAEYIGPVRCSSERIRFYSEEEAEFVTVVWSVPYRTRELNIRLTAWFSCSIRHRRRQR